MSHLTVIMQTFLEGLRNCKNKLKTTKTRNKPITMMRGKSLRSDVEMTKTRLRGGLLGFLTGISQPIWAKLGTHIQNSLLNKFCSLHSIQMSIFLELFKKNSFLTIYIHISKGRNSVKNCSVDQIVFTTGSEHGVFFCSLSPITF